jgi:hypothetical protein
MGFMSRINSVLYSIAAALLTSEYIRYGYTRLRYLFLKNKMRILHGFESSPIVAYNMQFNPAAFGCGGRMAILLFPLRGFLYPNHKRAKVLIVGPRTEDDIFWAKSLSLYETQGMDLFSYSPLIDLGDAHKTSYLENSFDAVLLGWVLPYIADPERVLLEMSRITKSGGIIGFGWHYVSDTSAYVNQLTCHALNSKTDIVQLVDKVSGQIFCLIDDETLDQDHHNAVFYKVVKT